MHPRILIKFVGNAYPQVAWQPFRDGRPFIIVAILVVESKAVPTTWCNKYITETNTVYMYIEVYVHSMGETGQYEHPKDFDLGKQLVLHNTFLWCFIDKYVSSVFLT